MHAVGNSRNSDSNIFGILKGIVKQSLVEKRFRRVKGFNVVAVVAHF